MISNKADVRHSVPLTVVISGQGLGIQAAKEAGGPESAGSTVDAHVRQSLQTGWTRPAGPRKHGAPGSGRLSVIRSRK